MTKTLVRQSLRQKLFRSPALLTLHSQTAVSSEQRRSMRCQEMDVADNSLPANFRGMNIETNQVENPHLPSPYHSSNPFMAHRWPLP
jgi:hypothetical protein